MRPSPSEKAGSQWDGDWRVFSERIMDPILLVIGNVFSQEQDGFHSINGVVEDFSAFGDDGVCILEMSDNIAAATVSMAFNARRCG